MQNEYEIIEHQHISHFKLFLVNLLYRTPHIHKDFELCLILEGTVTFFFPDCSISGKTGDFILINPFQAHELKTDHSALILSLQVSPVFFQPYFPQIDAMNFSPLLLDRKLLGSIYDILYQNMVDIAASYFRKEKGYELQCASYLNHIFYHIVKTCPYRLLSEKDRSASRVRQKRIRKIMDYIDQNYSEKLLLSDIASHENLTMTYLSHFFKECFGISFQEYLTRIRCEKARQLLLLTDDSLLDISIACGFSDPKYFKKGFQKQYGFTPKQYRNQFIHEQLPVQQESLLTTQEFLSDASALVILCEKYKNIR